MIILFKKALFVASIFILCLAIYSFIIYTAEISDDNQNSGIKENLTVISNPVEKKLEIMKDLFIDDEFSESLDYEDKTSDVENKTDTHKVVSSGGGGSGTEDSVPPEDDEIVDPPSEENESIPYMPEISVSDKSVNEGDEFSVEVIVNSTIPIYAVEFDFFYDDILEFVEVLEGEFLKRGSASTYFVTDPIFPKGVEYGCTRTGVTNGISGEGEVAIIRFRAVESGISELRFENVEVYDEDIEIIDFVARNASVQVSI